MFCGNCGAKVGDDDLFCTQCGARVRSGAFFGAAPESFSYEAPTDREAQPLTEEQGQPAPAVTQPYDHVRGREAAEPFVRAEGPEATAEKDPAEMVEDAAAEQEAIENFEQQAVQNLEVLPGETQPAIQGFDQAVAGQQYAGQQWNQYGQQTDPQYANQYGQWQQPADQQWNQYGQQTDPQYADQYGQWQQPADQQWNQYGQQTDPQYANRYGQWQQPAGQQAQGGTVYGGYDPRQGQSPSRKVKKERKKRRYAPVIILTILLLVLAAAAIWWFFLRHPKSDIALSKYISADFSGVDGYGTINAYLDYDELQKDIWLAMGHKEEDMAEAKSQKDLAMVYQFTGELYADISQKTGLKNGDKVKVSIDVPETIPDELCIVIRDSEKEFTVEGLQEVQMFDPFEGIEVTFRGMDPFVKADYERVKYDDLYYYVDFALDKTTGLSAGDTVTVTATYNKEHLNEMGYGVSTDSKTYTVTSEGAYILDASQLSENIKADLDARSKTYQQEQAAGWISVAELKDMAHIGYAFIADEDFDPDYDTKSNTLFMIYNVYISTDDGPMVVYLWYGYENVTQDGQGVQYTQTEIPYQVNDMGVQTRVWTANQKYYIAGFGTLDDMKAFLDNYYRQDGTVFYKVEDIPPRDIDWQQPASQSGAGHLTDDPNGYIFPGSNTEYLDEAFLRTLTDQELQYARNEIVARYGRKFTTPEIAAYFGAKSWYVPTYEPEEFDKMLDTLLNPVEKANVDLISKIESERADQKQ